MVKSKSTSRLSRIDTVILAQTDTTVGFLSQNSDKLDDAKSRAPLKQYLITYPNLDSFKGSNKRIPIHRRKLFRRAKKTTFIVKGTAFRISPTTLSSQILREMKWTYSTSANESGKNFDLDFCESKADIIITNKDGLSEKSSSKLLRINDVKIKRLR